MILIKPKRSYTYLIAAVFLLILIVWLKISSVNETTNRGAPAGNVSVAPLLNGGSDTSKVKVSVYYETLCPDSIAFITEQLWPTFTSIGNILDIDLIPYGKASYTPNGDSWDFSCQHGKRECLGNRYHACVINAYPINQAFSFIYCSMSSHDPIGSTETCAYKNNINAVNLETCATGPKGAELLHSNGVRTENLSPKLFFVPWILIDNTFSEAQLDLSLRNLRGVVCSAYKEKTQNECPV